MDLVTQKLLGKILKESSKKEVSPYTTTAEVVEVGGETTTVRFQGSDQLTEVASSCVSVKVGDVVDVAVSHEDTHITGNRTDNPPSTTAAESSTEETKQQIVTVATKAETTTAQVQDVATQTQLNLDQLEDVNRQIQSADERMKQHQKQLDSIASKAELAVTQTQTAFEQIQAVDGRIDALQKNASQEIEEAKAVLLLNREKMQEDMESLESSLAMLESKTGMFITEEPQPDGSAIIYEHDGETLEKSAYVRKYTADAIAFSTDGGATYPYGISITGDVIARLLQAKGISADWITAGKLEIADKTTKKVLFSADKDTGQVVIDGDLLASVLSAKGINADWITAGTLDVDRIASGSITTNEIATNAITGEKIKAGSIEADKLNVKDLSSLGATIGGVRINRDGIYSGSKDSLSSDETGFRLDSTGGINVGNATNHLKYYKDEEGIWRLAVVADTVLFRRETQVHVTDEGNPEVGGEQEDTLTAGEKETVTEFSSLEEKIGEVDSITATMAEVEEKLTELETILSNFATKEDVQAVVQPAVTELQGMLDDSKQEVSHLQDNVNQVQGTVDNDVTPQIESINEMLADGIVTQEEVEEIRNLIAELGTEKLDADPVALQQAIDSIVLEILTRESTPDGSLLTRSEILSDYIVLNELYRNRPSIRLYEAGELESSRLTDTFLAFYGTDKENPKVQLSKERLTVPSVEADTVRASRSTRIGNFQWLVHNQGNNLGLIWRG